MKKLMIIIGLLFSFQILQADIEKTVTLKTGYNAVQFDANLTLSELKEKIGTENLLMIQGAGQGSTYKKEYVDKGLDFLNSFVQTEAGKAFWFKVTNEVTFNYTAESFTGNKIVSLGEGWSFIGAMQPLTLDEIKSQLGADNLLIIQGAGQGSTYKKEYVDNGTAFLNSFTKFKVDQGYWVKVKSPASLTFEFELETIAKDNTNHSAEIVKTINGKSYTIKVYTNSTPTTETSQSTIAVYGNINGESVVISINSSYPEDSRFQVKVFDENGKEVGRSVIVDYNSSSIKFSDFTIVNSNPCITLEDLKTKIANNEDVTQVNTGCITDMSKLFYGNKTFNQDISGWDVSSVTDMYGMFWDAQDFNQDISKWNVSNVRDMSYMFYRAKEFNQDIGDWDVSKVTQMPIMFLEAESFNQDIGDWNVSSVTYMKSMFAETSFNQPIGKWDVSHVVNMNYMFSGNSKFNQDISSWDVSNVISHTGFADNPPLTNEHNPFYETPALPDYNVSIDLSQTHFTPGDTPVTVTLKVNELLGGTNSGDLELTLSKNYHFNLTMDNNSNWEVTDSQAIYRFKYIENNGKYTPNTESTITLTGIFHLDNGSKGSFPMTIGVRSGSGDKNSNNNEDSKQVTYDTLFGTAIAKIEAYAENSSNPIPTLQDYIDAKVVGVTAKNLDAVNSAVDNATKEEVDTLDELNGLVDSVIHPVSNNQKIVDRHNYYRNLDFQDSPLVWDETLADHAQQWADYLATNYTQALADAGQSPHAAYFNETTHGLPYVGEGENIAWASAGLKYVRDEAVDITVVNSSTENYEFGAVDMWANEKAYYDYASNSGNGNVVGHYTQVVWQKTTKVGCGKAHSTTDYPGDHIVCRYEIPGNMTGEKPYCSNYTVSDLYTNNNLVFTNTIINDMSSNLTKVVEDRTACTKTESERGTLIFTGTQSAVLNDFVFFESNGFAPTANFDQVVIDGKGVLTLTESNGNKRMILKLVGETADYYSAEAEWTYDINEPGYTRRAIVKLSK